MRYGDPGVITAMEKAGDTDAYRDQAESHVLSLCAKLVGNTTPPASKSTTASPWHAKEELLSQLAEALAQHPREAQEAVLCSGPNAVLDSILAIMVSERTQLQSKLLAADVLSSTCSDSKAGLLLCPGSIVERLMRFAYKGDADVKAAAARALWQLSCQHDFSPEVVSHAGSAFKVVELLAEDMQGGSSSSACMCALRATKNLLHTYATSTAAGDAGERIGGRMVKPLCNLLEPAQPEAAAAAAELLALLSATAPNRARIVAAGAIPRLVALLRPASSSSTPALQQQWNQADQAAATQKARQEQAAAQAALQVLGQLVREDAKLCSELLGAHVMPGLLQLLHNESCCAGALSLIGDLAALREGRRALQYVDGLAVLSNVAQSCPEQQLCRLLSKATKGSSGTSVDLAGLASSPALLAVLVRSCNPADIKTRKRSMQVLARLLEHARSAGKSQLLQLQQQLLALGLLQQIEAVLRLPAGQQQQPGSSQAGQTPGQTSQNDKKGTVLEVQLAVTLLQQVAACLDVLTGTAPAAATAAAVGSKVITNVQASLQVDSSSGNSSGNSSGKSSIVNSQLSSKYPAVPGPAAAAADAILASPSVVWRHPAAAAAAFGDFSQLVPGILNSAAAASTPAAQQHQQLNPTLPNLLWLLQQLLLSPSHHLPSLQQQVLQAVCEIATHKHTELLQIMLQQGWVQVLWGFLPGGKQLLAVTLSQLIQQQQSGSKGSTPAAAAAAAGTGPATMQGATQQQQQQQQQRRAAAGNIMSPKSGSSLQPHLLQLLDESLPSLEQTQAALQALAHLCSFPAAAAVAAQLQASYQAAAAAGTLTVRTSAYMMTGQQLVTPLPAGSGSSSAIAANPVVAMLFGGSSSSSFGGGGTSSPRAVPAMGTSAPGSSRIFGVGPGVTTGPLQPQSPGSLPSNPPSIARSSSSGASSGSSGGSSGGSSLVQVPPASSSSFTSSSGGAGSSLVRSSSTGLLSRLGISRNRDSSVQRGGQDTAAAAVGSRDGGSSKGQQQFGAISSTTHAAPPTGQAGHSKPPPAAGEPVEDPGSPIQMLVTLLGEQWAATASAELLAHLAAAAPAVCLQEMLQQGVAATLAECMLEIQHNSAGAVAALATLQLVQQLGRHCPEQLHAAGIVSIVLRLLQFECSEPAAAAAAAAEVEDADKEAAAAAAAVRGAALQVLQVLCLQRDRLLCSTVAQAVLLPLVRWLSSSHSSSSSSNCQAAAAVLTALLDCGVVDGTALAAVQGDEQRAELLKVCLSCLPNRQQQQQQQQQQEEFLVPARQQQQQQQLTAVRLLRAFVELDGTLVEAFLAADGLKLLISMLTAAVAAIAAAGSSSGSRAGAAAAAATASQADSREASAALTLHRQLMMQYELMAILDSLSLCHRRVLVQASIVPIIVGVLRQAHQHTAAAAVASDAPATGSSVGTTAAGTAVISSSTTSPAAAAAAVAAGSRSLARSGSSSSSSRVLGRSSNNAPGAASGLTAAAMSEGEILLRCKVIACNLITVLAINNDVKRQLFHSDAVGPLMQLAEAVDEGSSAQEAIRAALAQLGLVYLMPAAAAVGGVGGGVGGGGSS